MSEKQLFCPTCKKELKTRAKAAACSRCGSFHHAKCSCPSTLTRKNVSQNSSCGTSRTATSSSSQLKAGKTILYPAPRKMSSAKAAISASTPSGTSTSGLKAANILAGGTPITSLQRNPASSLSASTLSSPIATKHCSTSPANETNETSIKIEELDASMGRINTLMVKVTEFYDRFHKDVLPAMKLIDGIQSSLSTFLEGNGVILGELKSLKARLDEFESHHEGKLVADIDYRYKVDKLEARVAELEVKAASPCARCSPPSPPSSPSDAGISHATKIKKIKKIDQARTRSAHSKVSDQNGCPTSGAESRISCDTSAARVSNNKNGNHGRRSRFRSSKEGGSNGGDAELSVTCIAGGQLSANDRLALAHAALSAALPSLKKDDLKDARILVAPTISGPPAFMTPLSPPNLKPRNLIVVLANENSVRIFSERAL